MKNEIVKKEIQEYICSVKYYIIGDLNRIIDYLSELKEQYGSKYLRLEIEQFELDESNGFNLVGYRYETDVEYNSRLKSEASIQRMTKIRKQKEKEAEIELYKKLKEKYEKG